MNSNVMSVTIPKSVETIGSRAFKNCQNLAKIVFKEGSLLEEIEEDAFEGCKSIREVVFSNEDQLQMFKVLGLLK